MSHAPVGSAGSAVGGLGGCRYVLIAHRTVREIAELVDLSVEEVTHELEGYVLCAPVLRGRAPAPMRACHTEGRRLAAT